MNKLLALCLCSFSITAFASDQLLSYRSNHYGNSYEAACVGAQEDVKSNLDVDCALLADTYEYELGMIVFDKCDCLASGSNFWNCSIAGSATCHIDDKNK